MELTLEQIRACAAGGAVTQEADGIHFDRFTPTQHAAWENMAPRFLDASYTTTGCQIDFHTDSGSMTLEVAAPGKYEVLIDGMPRFLFHPQQPQALHMELDPGEKRVTVVLPSHRCGVLKGLRLEPCSTLRPHEYAMKMLFLGDSITQGWNSVRDSMSFSALVGRYFDAEVLNYGIGGTWFHAETLENVGFVPDMVIIAYGTNDYKHAASLDALQADCRAYLDRVRDLYGSSRVLCITPIWRADGAQAKNAGTIRDVRAVIASEAQVRGFHTVDGLKMVPHTADFYADAYLHPNDLGFSIYAQNLIREIRKYL